MTNSHDAAAAAANVFDAAAAAAAAAKTAGHQLQAQVASDQSTISGLQAQVATVTAQDQADQATIATLQGTIGELQSQLASQNQADQATIAGLQATVADLQAQVTELENELHPTPPPPPPPPPVTGTVWGINATSAAQHATQTQVWGLPRKPWCWRYYLQGGEPLHLPTEYTVGPGEQLVLSYGSAPQTLTLAALVAFFQSVPPWMRLYFCIRHEPEPKVDAGEFTLAQLRDGWALARQAQQQVGNPNIKLVVILTGFAWTSSHRNPEDYIPADSDFDGITSDTYFNGGPGQIGLDISTASGQFDKQIATAKAHGKWWGITETGVGPALSGQARLDAITSLSRLIKAKGAVLGLWFDKGQTSDSWWLDPAGVAAWEAGQV